MRNLLIAIGLLACAAALTGCDVWDRLTAPPKPQIVTCRCAPPIRGARDVEIERTTRLVPPRHRSARRHHYRHYAHSSRHAWDMHAAERSIDVYGYSSHSQSYGGRGSSYGEGYGNGEGYAYRYGSGSEHGAYQHYAAGAGHVWADGYGRRHRYDESAVEHYSYEAHQRALEAPQRLDPWHGYNDDWD